MSADKLTQQIRAAKIEQGVPSGMAQAQAEAIVAEKKAKTKLGLFILAVGCICSGLAYLLGLGPFWVIGIFGGGCIWGATAWDSELVTSTLKSIAEAIGGAIGAVLKPFRGGPS